MLIARNCGICQAPFSAKAYKVAEGKAKFCSKECAYKSKRVAPKNCETCGELITWMPGGHNRAARFCNKSCANHLPTAHSCLVCETVFTGSRNAEICSEECSAVRRKEVHRANAARHRERYNIGKLVWASNNKEKIAQYPSRVARQEEGNRRRNIARERHLERLAKRRTREFREAQLINDHKKCNRCGITKSLVEFSVARPLSRNDIWHPWCKTCLNARVRELNRQNPERYLLPNRKRYWSGRDTLSDAYVAGLLQLRIGDARPLIPAKREQLRIHRELKRRVKHVRF